jgi:nitrogen fixation protein FixH
MQQGISHHPIDKWLPWMIVAVFIVLAIVLGWFVRTAFVSFNGVVTTHAYEQGLAYNEEIAARQVQRQSGLTPLVNLTPLGDNRVRIVLQVKTAAYKIAAVSSATAKIIRPTRAGLDQTLVLRARASAYEAEIQLPARGVWDVVVTATVAGVRLQTVQRLVI